MAQDSKAIGRQLVELYSQGKIPEMVQLYAPNCVGHDELPGDQAGLTGLWNLYKSAFPDSTITPEDLITEGETTAVRYRFKGKHSGEGLGPPSGKPVDVRGIVTVRTSGGKITDWWLLYDGEALLKQIGAIPS